VVTKGAIIVTGPDSLLWYNKYIAVRRKVALNAGRIGREGFGCLLKIYINPVVRIHIRLLLD
jgi:hypothetical protein